MRTLLSIFGLILLLQPVRAQYPGLRELLEKNDSAEKGLHAGILRVRETHVTDSVYTAARLKTYTYFTDSLSGQSMHLLEAGERMLYSRDGLRFTSVERGTRRPVPRGFPDELFYSYQLMDLLSDFYLSRVPSKPEAQSYNRMHLLKSLEESDSLITVDYDSLERKIYLEMPAGQGNSRISHTWFLGEDYLVWKHQTRMVRIEGNKELFNTVHFFEYQAPDASHELRLNLSIRALETLPKISATAPPSFDHDLACEEGELLPDLMLMDSLGQMEPINRGGRKTLLIYRHFGPGDDSYAPLLSFIDSLEDEQPNWHLVVYCPDMDYVAYLQRQYPGLHSAKAVSAMKSGGMNGYPVWILVDEKRRIMAVEHGFSEKRKAGLVAWMEKGFGRN